MTALLIGLGILSASVAVGGLLILWSSLTLFRTAGAVDIEESLKPAYLREAESAVESLKIQYGVAEDLNQDLPALDHLRRRIAAAEQVLENAKKAAAEQIDLVEAPAVENPHAVKQPVPVRHQLPAVDDGSR